MASAYDSNFAEDPTCAQHLPPGICALTSSLSRRGLDQLQRTAQQQRMAQLRKLQQMQKQHDVQAATAAQRTAKQSVQDARVLSQREHQRRLAARQAADAAAGQVLLARRT